MKNLGTTTAEFSIAKVHPRKRGHAVVQPESSHLRRVQPFFWLLMILSAISVFLVCTTSHATPEAGLHEGADSESDSNDLDNQTRGEEFMSQSVTQSSDQSGTGSNINGISMMTDWITSPVQVSMSGNSGSASTAIPIAVPPGIKGLEPRISINYNSSYKNGWIGAGWNFEMGSIQRNATRGVDYSGSEFTVTGGVFSDLAPRDDWGIDYYGAKIEGAFFKYYKDPSGGWTVTSRDGTKYYYGSTRASRQDDPADPDRVFKWCMDRVEDVNGNYMEVLYTKEDGQIYLDRINYTGNIVTGLEPQVYVQFYNTDGRTDDPVLYDIGFAVKTSKRLAAIETGLVNSGIVRAYKLEYGISSATGRSLLSTVRQAGNDGSLIIEPHGEVSGGVYLPPLTFNYEGSSNGFDTFMQGPPWSDANGFDKHQFYSTIQFPDLNGDRMADVCTRTEGGISCFLSDGNAFSEPFVGPDWSNDNDWYYHKYYSTISYPDVNGDGKSDICGRNVNGVSCYLSDGETFAEHFEGPEWSDGNGWWKLEYYSTIRYPDLNGDGKADICARNSLGVTCYLSDGERFSEYFAGPEWSDDNGFDKYEYYSTIQFPDLNGDGMADICTKSENGIICRLSDGDSFAVPVSGPPWSTNNGWWQPQYYSTIRYPDLNGDGMADICARNENGIDCYLSSGTGLTEPFSGPEWSDMNYWNNKMYYSTISYLDVNGDGKSDVCGRNGKRVVCYLSNGKSFNKSFNGPLWSNDNGFDNAEYYSTIRYPDVNGDGKSDICVRTASQIRCEKTVNDGLEALSSISNGAGALTNLYYAPSSAYANEKLPFIVNTLSSVEIDDGNGVTSIVAYDYSGGFFDSEDREFRGFGSVAITSFYETTKSTTSESFYYLGSDSGGRGNSDDALKGLLYERTVYDSSDPAIQYLYSRTLDSYEVFHIHPENEWPKWPRLLKTRAYRYDGDNDESAAKESETSFEYDDYGNVTRKYFAGDLSVKGDERDEYTEYYADGVIGDWMISFPKSTYIKENTGTVAAREQYNYFAGTGNLYSKESMNNEGVNPVVYYESYDSYGNVTQVRDPRGYVTTYNYNYMPAYLEVSAVNALDHQFVRKINYAFGRTDEETGANGYAVSYEYDGFGRVVKVIGPEDSSDLPTVQYEYLNAGVLGSSFPEDNQKIKKCNIKEHDINEYFCRETYYDGLQRTVRTVSDGPTESGVQKFIVAETEYNDRGQVWKEFLPYFSSGVKGDHTEYVYDPVGRTTSVTFSDGSTVRSSYSKGVAAYVSSDGHQRAEVSDIYGRLVEVHEYKGVGEEPFSDEFEHYASTYYGYDILGNLEYVRDALGNETYITYDSLSRKTAMYDPDMGLWEYEYDRAGNLVYQVDGRDTELYFQYDGLNRILSRIYPDNTSVDYYYDVNEDGSTTNVKGRLAKLSDLSGETVYYYDAKGDITKTEKTIAEATYVTAMSYDAAGRMTALTYPDNPSNPTIIQYAYGTGGELLHVRDITDPLNATDLAVYSEYSAMGQPGRIDFSNGMITEYEYYDGTGESRRLKSIITKTGGGAELVHLDYEYSSGGNIEKIIDSVDPARSRTYDYDSLGRLAQVDSEVLPGVKGVYGGKLLFQYDEVGNMTYKCRNGYYFYDDVNHSHAVTSVQRDGAVSESYEYDGNGNMTRAELNHRDAVRTFVYDYDNRPAGIMYTANAGSENPNVKALVSVYDAGGKRVSKMYTADTDPMDPAAVPIYTVTYVGDIMECTDGDCEKYIFAGSQRVAKIDSSGDVFHYHSDHLGSPLLVTDNYPEIDNNQQETFYFPYGEVYSDSGAAHDTAHKFTGQEWDGETGLYYYGARYYDPWLGRFTSADTIVPSYANPQTFNRYSYTNNNPVIYTDPDGHFAFLVGFVVGAIVSGIQSDWDLESMVVGGVIGAISGGVFSGVEGAVAGAIQGSITNSTVAGAISGSVGGAAAGATAGGMSAAYYGGDINKGIMQGAGYGAVGGAAFGAIGGHYGDSWTLDRVAAHGVAGGGVSELSGGDFVDGFAFAAIPAASRYVYNEWVNYDVTWESGGEAVKKGRYEYPIEGANNVGVQGDPSSWAREGSFISRVGNSIPGVNAVAGMHDVFQINLDHWGGSFAREVFNVPGMVPAAAASYSALMTDYSTLVQYQTDLLRK